MILKSSLEIINKFLYKEGIELNGKSYLKKYLVNEDNYCRLPEDIIIKIIADAYDLNKELVKTVTDFLVTHHNFYFGRIQKEQLKKYIDYGFEEDLEILINLVYQDIPPNLDLAKEIKRIIIDNPSRIDYGVYLGNLKQAIEEKKENRIADYLLFLYSRLINLNERRFLSLNDIFEINKSHLKKELPKEDYIELELFCSSEDKIKNKDIVSKFNEKYIQILEKNGKSSGKSALVFLNVDQRLFNKFNKEKQFFSYLLCIIEDSYSKLQNHKTLAIRVRNIISNGLNIKWRLYAYLTIFAEKFKRIKGNKAYYKPTEVCIDILKHKYNIELNQLEIQLLDRYYSENLSIDYLNSINKFSSSEIKDTINYFKEINHGFSFIDCFILKTKDAMENSDELHFLKNENEILLIFTKHEVDDRKIPCPVCAGLKISGNSYPEIGIKSWECKNPLCSERSKTNRGKRYSGRTIFMQNANFNFSKENRIPKELIKVWRKDVVLEWDLQSLYSMLVKFFTYVGDKITIVNPENPDYFSRIIRQQGRKVKSLLLEEGSNISYTTNKFDEFFHSGFIELFLYQKRNAKHHNINLNFKKDGIKIILGDCYEILDSIKTPIHNMVTSPPYYNAREYSQWKNLFNYLNDVYNINLKANSALITGGVFFYNVGDIFGNENIVVKSKMGEKRIPLGAYTIFLFEKAGFEILDNIIWYKGDPQSNRHKNDGNYTPYYQRPTNCYEHMFIFKKKGKLILNNNKGEMSIKSNIMKFNPVFKISKGGENRYGHTAPFPKMIPLLSITTFTNENDIVLDPFSGSGTTAIAANLHKRKGVGIETNQDYVLLSLEKAKQEKVNSELVE